MIWWLALALLLQLAGSVIAAAEVWRAHQRWTKEFGGPEARDLHSVTATRTIVSGAPDLVERDDLTFDGRLSRLEERQRSEHKAMSEEVRRLAKGVPEVAEAEAVKVEARLRPQIARTLGYLAGQGARSRWMPWWLGPSLILLGTLISGVASVVAAAT